MFQRIAGTSKRRAVTGAERALLARLAQGWSITDSGGLWVLRRPDGRVVKPLPETTVRAAERQGLVAFAGPASVEITRLGRRAL